MLKQFQSSCALKLMPFRFIRVYSQYTSQQLTVRQADSPSHYRPDVPTTALSALLNNSKTITHSSCGFLRASLQPLFSLFIQLQDVPFFLFLFRGLESLHSSSPT